MSWLLVVQPDSEQADTLLDALRAYVSQDVVVAESLEDALSSIDQDIPDALLLPTLTPAGTEDYLIAYLGTIPTARHVQILGLPQLEQCDRPVEPRARSVLRWRWGQRTRGVRTRRCDSAIFTRDVVTYLARASALREQNELYDVHAASREMPDRRTEPRFANCDVPWISFARLGSERAALINVSARGALVRTRRRPEHRFLRRADPPVRERSGLTLELESHGEVHAVGRVIRCVPLKTCAQTEYEIAFSFDDSVGLHLPAGSLVPVNR
jgi:hypothetical protein